MISENFKIIRSQIPENVCLVAVSKTKPKELILEAYNLGQRHFGENKVQELSEKASALPKDIQWHLIGHLQTNKVKYIAEFVHLIHAVDSLKLLQEINKQALKHNRVIACLLQFHIADEETKFGLSREEAKQLLSSESYSALQNIKIHNCYYPYNVNQFNQQFLNLGKQKYGLYNDALHKQNDGHKKRYIRVFNWLKENNLNGWVKKS